VNGQSLGVPLGDRTVIIEPALLRSPRALQRTTALLGSRTVRVIWQGLLQPTGRFRRLSLSLV
jgi:hypothetical protein